MPYRPPTHPEPQQRPLRSLGGAAAVMQEPAKMEIHVLDSDMDTDLDDSARWLQAQFNPNEINEAVRANWPKLTIQGLSHERTYYQNTASVPFRVELYFDALAYANLNDSVSYIKLACNFLRSLFWWPQFINLTAIVESIDFKYSKYASTGIPLKFTAAVSMMEIRDVRMTRSGELGQGNQRSAPLAGRE